MSVKIVDGVKHYGSNFDEPVLGEERIDCGSCDILESPSPDCAICDGAGHVFSAYTRSDIDEAAAHLRTLDWITTEEQVSNAITSMYGEHGLESAVR